jgi:hypothetical protein
MSIMEKKSESEYGSEPRKPLSAYLYFKRDQKDSKFKIKWSSLTSEEKQKYIDISNSKKESYKEELKSYLKKHPEKISLKYLEHFNHGDQHPNDKYKIYNKLTNRFVSLNGPVARQVLKEINVIIENNDIGYCQSDED